MSIVVLLSLLPPAAIEIQTEDVTRFYKVGSCT
jgi:hypothetical protein